MNKKQKKMLIRIIVAAVLIVLFSKLPIDGYVRFGLFMIPYLVIGYDILQKAFKGIRNKQVFDENFLMAVATVGAILLGDYSEGVAVMLFYQIGELFQSYAVGKSRRNISELMDIRPDYANIEVDGKLEQIFNDDLVNDAAMRESRKALLKKYNIKDAQGYESAVNRLRNEFSGTAKAIITEKETRMLERCAGEQYVNLSEKSKKRIMDKVIGSRDIALDNQLRTTLNVYLPKKWEDSFLR